MGKEWNRDTWAICRVLYPFEGCSNLEPTDLKCCWNYRGRISYPSIKHKKICQISNASGYLLWRRMKDLSFIVISHNQNDAPASSRNQTYTGTGGCNISIPIWQTRMTHNFRILRNERDKCNEKSDVDQLKKSYEDNLNSLVDSTPFIGYLKNMIGNYRLIIRSLYFAVFPSLSFSKLSWIHGSSLELASRWSEEFLHWHS